MLKQQENGQKTADICREHGISLPTFYQWKSKYSGLDVAHLKKMKEMEAELAQYKKSLQSDIMKAILQAPRRFSSAPAFTIKLSFFNDHQHILVVMQMRGMRGPGRWKDDNLHLKMIKRMGFPSSLAAFNSFQ